MPAQSIVFSLDGSPYTIDATGQHVLEDAAKLDGPTIFWSIPDPLGIRQWKLDDTQSPGVAELTLDLPDVDRWAARLPDGAMARLESSEVARRVAEAVVDSLVAD